MQMGHLTVTTSFLVYIFQSMRILVLPYRHVQDPPSQLISTPH